MINAPYFSTSFSKNGKKVKKRLDNILNENKKPSVRSYFTAVLMLATVLTTAVGCSEQDIAIIGGADGPTDIYTATGNEAIDKIYASKLKYVGDNSGVGNVLNTLAKVSGLENAGFELVTSGKPFGVIEKYKTVGAIDYAQMKSRAAAALALIANAEFFEYQIDGNTTRYTLDDLNREYCVDLKKSGESAESFASLYSILYNPVSTIDEGVSRAIISISRDGYLQGEFNAEGHIILDTEPEDKTQTDTTNTVVYALITYREFGFVNDCFTDISGCGVIPARIVLDRNLRLADFKLPEDGSLYVESIKNMFPKSLWNRAIKISNDDREVCDNQLRKYAEDYLKKIGRDAQVVFSNELKYTPLDISTGASNRLLDLYGEFYELHQNSSRETLENGVRYRYTTDWQGKSGIGKITFSKYADGKLAQKTVINVNGDELSIDELYNAPSLLDKK